MFRRLPHALRVSPALVRPAVASAPLALRSAMMAVATTRLRVTPALSPVSVEHKRWSGSDKWMPDAPRFFGEKRPRNNDPVVDEHGNFLEPLTDEDLYGTDWNDSGDRMRDYTFAILPPAFLYFLFVLYRMHEEKQHLKHHPRPYFPSPYFGQPVNMPWKNWRCTLFDPECHAYFNLKRKLKAESMKNQNAHK